MKLAQHSLIFLAMLVWNCGMYTITGFIKFNVPYSLLLEVKIIRFALPFCLFLSFRFLGYFKIHIEF